MKLFFLVLRAVISFLLLVVPTTLCTFEFVTVAGYSASGHLHVIFLNQVLLVWSFYKAKTK